MYKPDFNKEPALKLNGWFIFTTAALLEGLGENKLADTLRTEIIIQLGEEEFNKYVAEFNRRMNG